MKIQDVGFVVLLVILLFRRDPRLFALAGIACLFLAMPLFSLWIFFTAERLTWYAAAFFFISVILHMIRLRK